MALVLYFKASKKNSCYEKPINATNLWFEQYFKIFI